MTIPLSEGRFWALSWLIRRNALQIAVGHNNVCGILFIYFRDNSCVSLQNHKIVIMSRKGEKITITKEG